MKPATEEGLFQGDRLAAGGMDLHVRGCQGIRAQKLCKLTVLAHPHHAGPEPS